MLVAMKCPSCAADLQIDNEREFMFCQFCGTKIVNLAEKVEISGNLNIDNTGHIDNLVKRGYEFEQSGNVAEAIKYYNQALDYDACYLPARQGLERLRYMVTEPNVFINYSCLSHNYLLTTFINNKLKTVYQRNESQSFTLQPGNYIIKFVIGSHAYSRKIVITDRFSKANINFIHDGRNRIELIN